MNAAHTLLARAAQSAAADTVLFARLIGARIDNDDLPLLGLDAPTFGALIARHFAFAIPFDFADAVLWSPHLAFVRDLHTLLMQEDVTKTHNPDDARCLAAIISTACLRPDHLWRDLGLNGRDDVTAMLERHYPALVARNVTQMRWKKFLAQEVARAKGVTPIDSTIQAPGCPGCEDYAFCYPTTPATPPSKA